MDLHTYKVVLTVIAGVGTLGMGVIALRNIAQGEPGAIGDLMSALLGALVTLGMTHMSGVR